MWAQWAVREKEELASWVRNTCSGYKAAEGALSAAFLPSSWPNWLFRLKLLFSHLV